MSFQEEVRKARMRNSAYMVTLEDLAPDLERIWTLVQENDDFFGNPVAGSRKLKVAADKLEEIVREYNE